MALEPRDVGAEPEDNPELMDMTRRFWVGLVLTVPLVVIAMGDYIPGVSIESMIHAPWAYGSSGRLPHPWCCGAAGRSSSAAGDR